MTLKKSNNRKIPTNRKSKTTHTTKRNSTNHKYQPRNKKGQFVSNSKSRTTSKSTQTLYRNEQGQFISQKGQNVQKQSTKKPILPPRNDLGQFTSPKQVGSPKHTGHTISSPKRKFEGDANLIQHIRTNGTAESIHKETQVARKIAIKGGNLKDKERIAAAISDNFTTAEIDKFASNNNKVSVTIGHPDKGADAQIAMKTIMHDKPFEITVSKQADADAITHEFIHLARTVDKKRKYYAKTPYRTDGKGRRTLDDTINKDDLSNAEESATTAETTVRTKNPTLRPNTYFDELGKRDPFTGMYERSRRDNYKHDRECLRRYSTGRKVSDGTSIKGVNAIKMFLGNYKSTYISQRKKGDKTAVSIYDHIYRREKKRTKQRIIQ